MSRFLNTSRFLSTLAFFFLVALLAACSDDTEGNSDHSEYFGSWKRTVGVGNQQIVQEMTFFEDGVFEEVDLLEGEIIELDGTYKIIPSEDGNEDQITLFLSSPNVVEVEFFNVHINEENDLEITQNIAGSQVTTRWNKEEK